jgi:hypothetical protein
LTNILPKQSTTIHGRKEDSRVNVSWTLTTLINRWNIHFNWHKHKKSWQVIQCHMRVCFNKLVIILEHLHMEQRTHPFQLLNHVIIYQNLVYWPKCPNNAYIGYISFKILCMMRMWNFYNKRFRPKKWRCQYILCRRSSLLLLRNFCLYWK